MSCKAYSITNQGAGLSTISFEPCCTEQKESPLSVASEGSTIIISDTVPVGEDGSDFLIELTETPTCYCYRYIIDNNSETTDAVINFEPCCDEELTSPITLSFGDSITICSTRYPNGTFDESVSINIIEEDPICCYCKEFTLVNTNETESIEFSFTPCCYGTISPISVSAATSVIVCSSTFPTTESEYGEINESDTLCDCPEPCTEEFYCISNTGFNIYNDNFSLAGTYYTAPYWTGSTNGYYLYYKYTTNQWCLSNTLGGNCLLAGKSPCYSNCPDLFDSYLSVGLCPTPTPTPTQNCSVLDFNTFFDCSPVDCVTPTPTTSSTPTPTPTPSATNVCNSIVVDASIIKYTPTPTATPTQTPTQSGVISRPYTFSGDVTFNTINDYINCPITKRFVDCNNPNIIYTTNDVLIVPGGGSIEIDMVFNADVDGNTKCISYLGTSSDITGVNTIILNSLSDNCYICEPTKLPPTTPTQTPTPTITPTNTITPTPTPSQTPSPASIFADARAIYSLRLVNPTYGGSAIRVRRSSDNVEQNIGFVLGDLDISSLTSFIGSDTGYVVTWFDQSSNSFDINQTNTIKQPKIINTGTLYTLNSKPSVYFDNTVNPNILVTDFMSGLYNTSSVTSFSVASKSSGGNSKTTYSRILSFNKSANSDYDNQYSLILYLGGGTAYTLSSNLYIDDSFVLNTQTLFTSTRISGDLGIGINGGSLITASAGLGSMDSEYFRIGNDTNEIDSGLIGHVQEVIIYNSDKTSIISNVKTDINTYYSVY